MSELPKKTHKKHKTKRSLQADLDDVSSTPPKRAKAEPVKNVPIEAEVSTKKKHKTKRLLQEDVSTPPEPVKNVPIEEEVSTRAVPLTPSAIEEPSTHVSLEALLAQVSPIKNRRFVGELVDEKSSIQLVGFDPVSQAKLEELSQQKLPILLENCDVQYNKFTKKLEVIVKRYTKIDVSSRTFQVADVDSIGAKSISLEELRSMQEFDRVNVRVKVIDIKKTQYVGNNKKKQEIVIADSTSNCVLTLWENDIDTLELDESYYMSKMLVRVFNDDFSLSFQASGSKVAKIDDLDDVDEHTTDTTESRLEGVTIIAIKDFQSFQVCMFCNGKLDVNGDYGSCQKCKTMQKVNRCAYNEMAKIVVESPGPEITTLVAYADMLKCIVDGGLINAENLMKAKPFDVTYNMYNVITSVSK